MGSWRVREGCSACVPLPAAGSAAGGLQEVAREVSSAWSPAGSLLMEI